MTTEERAGIEHVIAQLQMIANWVSTGIGVIRGDITTAVTNQANSLSALIAEGPSQLQEKKDDTRVDDTQYPTKPLATAASNELPTQWSGWMSPNSAASAAPGQQVRCLCTVVTGGHLAINQKCPLHSGSPRDEQP